jgi:hypothetical protein
VADIQSKLDEYRAVLKTLADAAREAADPSLSPDARLEKARLMRPLWQRFDGLKSEIDCMIGV